MTSHLDTKYSCDSGNSNIVLLRWLTLHLHETDTMRSTRNVHIIFTVDIYEWVKSPPGRAQRVKYLWYSCLCHICSLEYYVTSAPFDITSLPLSWILRHIRSFLLFRKDCFFNLILKLEIGPYEGIDVSLSLRGMGSIWVWMGSGNDKRRYNGRGHTQNDPW